MHILQAEQWQAYENTHAARADALTAAHRERRARGQQHPIEDFLFSYYRLSPNQLRKWHPGAGFALEDADAERATWRYYTTVHRSSVSGRNRASHVTIVNLEEFFAERETTVDYIETLLRNTLEARPQFGCFGLHEWAMVYQLNPQQRRHPQLHLRLGAEETDRVVENSHIACSHFDAYRFFTSAAQPLNRLRPSRETQTRDEQPACLHAGMDIYKWVGKLEPIVPGDLLLDAFELARDIRVVDMCASPYDVSGYGYTAIPIETPEGKREYARLQRGFAERSNVLRQRVLSTISHARELREAHLYRLMTPSGHHQ